MVPFNFHTGEEQPPGEAQARVSYDGPDYPQQPLPTPHDPSKPNIFELVQDDLEVRALEGRRRYGTYLQPDNGRDVLRDIYEEILDAAQYIRQELYRRDGR